MPEPFRSSVEGAYAWMLASLPVDAPYDDEVNRCGEMCRRRRDYLYVGASLGALFAFVRCDKATASYVDWTWSTIESSVKENPVLAVIASGFAQYFLSDERTTKDLDRIAGAFVLNQLGISAPASDRLRGFCSDNETRRAVGRQILLRGNLCLKGYPQAYWKK